MARTHSFNSKRNVVDALVNLDDTSRFLKLQLVNDGYLVIEPVHTATRGRPAHKYDLTAKAKRLVTLANYWPKAG